MDVLAERIINQQVRSLCGYLEDARDLVEDAPEGISARADPDHIRTHPHISNMEGLRYWAHRSAMLNVYAAEEHLRGIRAILTDSELLPLPAMALGRSVYDAVIQTCWLIDVEVSVEREWRAGLAGSYITSRAAQRARLDSTTLSPPRTRRPTPWKADNLGRT